MVLRGHLRPCHASLESKGDRYKPPFRVSKESTRLKFKGVYGCVRANFLQRGQCDYGIFP